MIHPFTSHDLADHRRAAMIARAEQDRLVAQARPARLAEGAPSGPRADIGSSVNARTDDHRIRTAPIENRDKARSSTSHVSSGDDLRVSG